MSRAKKIIRVLAVASLGGAIWFGYILWDYTQVAVPDGYAAWSAAALINEFMDAHDGALPRGWGDLRETLAKRPQPSGVPMADIEARVVVDWAIDPRALAADPNAEVRLVWLQAGRRLRFGVDPNELIRSHIRDRQKNTAETRGAGGC